MQMKLLFSLTSLLILTFTSRGNGEWLYYKHYPWVWDNMSQDWLYLSGSSDGKIYSYRASTQEWEEFSVPASILTVDLNSSVSLKMIWVDPGTFRMGSPTTEAGRETHEPIWLGPRRIAWKSRAARASGPRYIARSDESFQWMTSSRATRY